MFCESEGNIKGGGIREPSANPAQSEAPGMPGNSMRENRETPDVSVEMADRSEKPKAQVRGERIWGVERLHSTSEACEQEAGNCQAERVEGRRSAKENPRHGPMLDTVPEHIGAL